MNSQCLSKFPLKENYVLCFVSHFKDSEFYPYMQTKIGEMNFSANLQKVHFYMNKITDFCLYKKGWSSPMGKAWTLRSSGLVWWTYPLSYQEIQWVWQSLPFLCTLCVGTTEVYFLVLILYSQKELWPKMWVIFKLKLRRSTTTLFNRKIVIFSPNRLIGN